MTPRNEINSKCWMCLSRYADSAQYEMKKGNFLNATEIWGDMEEAVLKLSDDVVCANHFPF